MGQMCFLSIEVEGVVEELVVVVEVVEGCGDVLGAGGAGIEEAPVIMRSPPRKLTP